MNMDLGLKEMNWDLIYKENVEYIDNINWFIYVY